MSSFTSPLIVRIHTKKPRERELYVPFSYVTNADDKITVPKGFFTNFASTPRILWPILPPLDHYGKAAVVHDFLYRTTNHPYTRKQADDIFREACEVLGVKKWKIILMYYTLRLFGWHAWNKYRKDTTKRRKINGSSK
ncbi:MAG: DUF1353 domain-containing protein [Methanobacteriota archaeon]|nr:MAG: DUF1353 domain-containing protein [Euryarchaeota archaeon]